jgi:hypothetical protein
MAGDFLDDDDTSGGFDLVGWIEDAFSAFGEGLAALFVGIVIILILVAIIGHEVDKA